MVLLRYRSHSGTDMMKFLVLVCDAELLQLTIGKSVGDAHLLYRIVSLLHLEALTSLRH
jgi:hypothetical protein